MTDIFIKIGDEQIEVDVTSDGMFYDKQAKSVRAKTLETLKKKLIELRAPKGEVKVESSEGKKGTVIGRITTKSRWQKHYVNIRWEDGKITEESPSYLRRILSPEEKNRLAELESLASSKEDEADEAKQNASEYIDQFSVTDEINQKFPLL